VLVLVRHGQSEKNAAGALVGRHDSDLTPLGERQAAATGSFLRAERGGNGSRGPARLLTSPLKRARRTADLLAAALGEEGRPLICEVEERLIELDYGDLDGALPGELDPAMWAAWRSDPAWRPPGGETFLELHERLDPLWTSLAAAAADGDVFCVTHVSPIKAAVAWAIGAGPELAWRLSLRVASVTRVSTAGGQPALVTFGETGHLLGL
jgi:broad specificity phosphatase PhoE